MKKLFVPCYLKGEITPVLEKTVKKLEKIDSIGLYATAQHLNRLERAKNFLEKHGKRVFVGGQILGCSQPNLSSLEKNVDAFLYIGSGRFHPMGIALKTEKPVFVLNPYSRRLDRIGRDDRRRWLKRQRGRVMGALNAETLGIMVSTKTGQFDLKKALGIKREIERKSKKAFIFAGGEITPANTTAFEVDAWINTACPRLVDDDFGRPVVNPDELILSF